MAPVNLVKQIQALASECPDSTGSATFGPDIAVFFDFLDGALLLNAISGLNSVELALLLR